MAKAEHGDGVAEPLAGTPARNPWKRWTKPSWLMCGKLLLQLSFWGPPASGTTTYAYNEHGELTSQIDARGIGMSRAVDALDRPMAVTYPTPDLNVSYTYDDPAVSFSKGRLTRIARGTSAIDYRYDRFGRLTQDGELSYGYDVNGNPTSLVYPGGVTAYDFADRPASLLAQRAGKPDQPLVSLAGYLPYGPLNTLTLGNGVTETHSFTQRYFPSTITLGSLLSWTYTTDKVGNISAITDVLSSANKRALQALLLSKAGIQG